MVVFRDGGRELLFNGYRVSVSQDEESWGRMVVMDAQQGEYI